MKRSFAALLSALLLLLSLPSVPAYACGPESDCVIGERFYRIKMPDGHDGTTPVGAIIHAHGYKGTAKGIISSRSLTKMASRLGVALIAPKSAGSDWVIPGAPRKRDVDGSIEFNYFDALIEDAITRFPVDRNRLMVSGFSAGGMMVWNLACHRGNRFAAFAPVAGTFWEDLPASCPSSPVNLIHTHGTRDKTVPLAGRRIADTKQGDIREALSLFTRIGGFGKAEQRNRSDLECQRRMNTDGKILEFCTHTGGHSIKAQWLERAWREFEKLGVL